MVDLDKVIKETTKCDDERYTLLIKLLVLPRTLDELLSENTVNYLVRRAEKVIKYCYIAKQASFIVALAEEYAQGEEPANVQQLKEEVERMIHNDMDTWPTVQEALDKVDWEALFRRIHE